MCVIKCKGFITIKYLVAWKVYLSLMEYCSWPAPRVVCKFASVSRCVFRPAVACCTFA